jgi:hypothetical protein
MRRLPLSYANVISSIALFVALGGTGYAVTQLPRNSVGNRQLKANAVTSAKIRARAVQRSDLAPNARGGARGPRGPAGPAGQAGPLGPSETIQVKRADTVSIPIGAGGAATIATITLEPGSWLLDANTTVVFGSVESADYFECLLQTASGDVLVKGLMRGGGIPGSVLAGHVPVRIGTTLTVQTRVNFLCRHDNPVTGATPYADRTTLQATRVGSLENR